MKTLPFRATLLILLLATLGGCEGGGAPQVHDARIVLPPPGMSMAAGYFEVRNPGATPLRLLRVSSPAFQSVEMHETVTEQGMSRMRELKDVEVPAHGRLRFEPGGKHLMLMGGPEGSGATQGYPMSLELVGADGRPQRVEVSFSVERAGEPHAH